jgi:hypothetical protein
MIVVIVGLIFINWIIIDIEIIDKKIDEIINWKAIVWLGIIDTK